MTDGLPDLQGLLAQAQQMQAELAATQQELADRRVDGDSGGGLVRATVSGAGELVGLRIESDAIDPEDPDTLADLVLAAYRDAANKASELQQEAMDPITRGLGAFGLPGM